MVFLNVVDATLPDKLALPVGEAKMVPLDSVPVETPILKVSLYEKDAVKVMLGITVVMIEVVVVDWELLTASVHASGPKVAIQSLLT